MSESGDAAADGNLSTLIAPLVARAEALMAHGGRRLLGIAGPPGTGKSTLAKAVAVALGSRAISVPMDGFHLAQTVLAGLGRLERKGAPDTFDANGYISLLKRIKAAQPGEVVYAPSFRRDIEEPIAGAIAVPAEIDLVITEGNYLLLDGEWAPVRQLLDEVWFVDTDAPVRDAWLLARLVAFGRSPAAAQEWINTVDAPNAAVITAASSHADWIVRYMPGAPLHCSAPARFKEM